MRMRWHHIRRVSCASLSMLAYQSHPHSTPAFSQLGTLLSSRFRLEASARADCICSCGQLGSSTVPQLYCTALWYRIVQWIAWWWRNESRVLGHRGRKSHSLRIHLMSGLMRSRRDLLIVSTIRAKRQQCAQMADITFHSIIECRAAYKSTYPYTRSNRSWSLTLQFSQL